MCGDLLGKDITAHSNDELPLLSCTGDAEHRGRDKEPVGLGGCLTLEIARHGGVGLRTVSTGPE